MDQTRAREIGGRRELDISREQGRRAHRRHRFPQQQFGMHFRVTTGAVADRQIDVGHREIADGHVGQHPHFEVWLQLLETIKPRHQPFRRERGRHGNRDTPLPKRQTHHPRRLQEQRHCLARERQSSGARVGQLDAAG